MSFYFDLKNYNEQNNQQQSFRSQTYAAAYPNKIVLSFIIRLQIFGNLAITVIRNDKFYRLTDLAFTPAFTFFDFLRILFSNLPDIIVLICHIVFFILVIQSKNDVSKPVAIAIRPTFGISDDFSFYLASVID